MEFCLVLGVYPMEEMNFPSCPNFPSLNIRESMAFSKPGTTPGAYPPPFPPPSSPPFPVFSPFLSAARDALAESRRRRDWD